MLLLLLLLLTCDAWQWLTLNLTSYTPRTAWGIVFLLDGFLILRKSTFQTSYGSRDYNIPLLQWLELGCPVVSLHQQTCSFCVLSAEDIFTGKMIRMCGIWKSWCLKSLKQLSWLITGTWIYSVDMWGLLIRFYLCNSAKVQPIRYFLRVFSSWYPDEDVSWKLLKLIAMTVHWPVLATVQLFCSSGGYTVDSAVILSPILSFGNIYVPKVPKLDFLCRINPGKQQF